MTRYEVFQAINAERAHQDEKWGPNFDRHNTPNDWVTYIIKYVGQAVTMPWNRAIFRINLIKAAALIVAALEQYDYAPRHYDLPNATCVETREERVA